MPPKNKPTKIPAPVKNVPVAEYYVLDFIVNQLLLIRDLLDTTHKILIEIKIGDEISFNLITNKVDCEFQKTKTSHEIKVTQDQLKTLVGMPVEIYFREAPPEEDNIDNKNDADTNKNIDNRKNSATNKNIEKKNLAAVAANKKIDKKNAAEKKNAAGAGGEEIVEIPKIEPENFGELIVDWQPIVIKRVSENKFSIHTQFLEQDILKPIIKPPEESDKPGEDAAKNKDEKPTEHKIPTEEIDEEEPPREPIGNIQMVLRLRVKPKADRGGLADNDGTLNVADEIENNIDPNDTIFVIGNDKAAKYEQFLTYCNDAQCQNRIDLSKFKKLHGRLVNSVRILSPCGNLDCCDELSDHEDCYCDKVISEMEQKRKQNFCYKLKR